LAAAYAVPVLTAEVPDTWTAVSPAMRVAPAVPAPPELQPAIATCLRRLQPGVCALLARIDYVGVNLHPYFKGACIESPVARVFSSLVRPFGTK
jgi:hypothetical protein